MIRDVTLQDADAICQVYNYYIKNTVVTFEETEVFSAEIQARIKAVTVSFPWIVFLDKDRLLGYAYAKPWHIRSAYRFSVESSVYIHHQALNQSIGSQLYQELLTRLNHLDVHVVLGGIALPNPSSIALHEKFGFEKVAHFKSVGYKFHQWVDVGYWQLILS
ncbi:MAG: GNAT family N-acetyltransferase [Microcoleaceae cyanobacterium]